MRAARGEIIVFNLVRKCEWCSKSRPLKDTSTVDTMPTIHFDCLIPETDVPAVQAAFNKLTTLLLRDKAAAKLDFSWGSGSADQLREAYPAADPSWPAYSFTIKAEGVAGSVNQLAMVYSKILNPPQELPDDPVLLQAEENFEAPPKYHWSVHVFG